MISGVAMATSQAWNHARQSRQGGVAYGFVLVLGMGLVLLKGVSLVLEAAMGVPVLFPGG
jgi:hypothetical protein